MISPTIKDLNIIGLIPDHTACGYYRLMNPINVLGVAGATIHLLDCINPFTAKKLYDPNKINILIAPRQSFMAVYDIIRYLQWHNWHVIYETDDDLFHLDKCNPAYRLFTPGSSVVKSIGNFASQCNGVTCSTPELAKWFSKFNKNIQVVPNRIDYSLRDWGVDINHVGDGVFKAKLLDVPRPENRLGKFVIGYSGGSSHKDDFKLIIPALNKFMNDNPDALLCLNIAKTLIEHFMPMFTFPTHQIEVVPTTSFELHPKNLFGMDVQLAPLEKSQFTLSKSSLKLMEGLASGSRVIGSCVAPYARFHSENPDLVTLVGSNSYSESTWYNALTKIKNEPNKSDLQIEGRKRMLEKYSLEGNILDWFNSWITLLESAQKGILGPQYGMEKDFLSFNSIDPKKGKCLITGKSIKEGYNGAW